MADIDVVIVGAGPAGIGAATALSRAGVKRIVVLERDDELGGVPQHIHHPTFGLLTFRRPMSGPNFIAKILRKCENVDFRTNASVLSIAPNGLLEVTSPAGRKIISARHIILATGAREKPRHARLIPGLRPQGITTTGALQKFVYGTKRVPFEHPVIVGTELVSFSALWTLKSAGAKAVAMIETNRRITTYRPAILAAALMRTPIELETQIIDIKGRDKVESVLVRHANGHEKTIPCDGVIFSGNFVGETALTKQSHLQFGKASHLPLIDQNWVSSDPQISIIGNGVHPADMGDQCYLEGLDAGKHVGEMLKIQNSSSVEALLEITHDKAIKMATPSLVRPSQSNSTKFDIDLHVRAFFNGTIQVASGKTVLYSKHHRCHPARRITLRKVAFDAGTQTKNGQLHISLKAK